MRSEKHTRAIGPVILVFAIAVTACQRVSLASEGWTPSYLQLHLSSGEARVQRADTSEWMSLIGDASLMIKGTERIVAHATQGAHFRFGDGSSIRLSAGAAMEARELHTLPRLQIVLQNGSLLFVAQKRSYEFVMPACSAIFLSVPAEVRISVNDESTHLAVEQGAVNCVQEASTITLLMCQELYVTAGEQPEVDKFCTVSTEAAPTTLIPEPSSTPWWVEPIETLSPPPSRAPVLTATLIAPTDTAVPAQPKSADDSDRQKPANTPVPVPPTQPPVPPTDPPPTSIPARPTSTPVPVTEPPPPTDPPPPPTDPPPPPTDPPPPPTDPPPPPTDPPPPPTDPPPRPTDTSSASS